MTDEKCVFDEFGILKVETFESDILRCLDAKYGGESGLYVEFFVKNEVNIRFPDDSSYDDARNKYCNLGFASTSSSSNFKCSTIVYPFILEDEMGDRRYVEFLVSVISERKSQNVLIST